MSSNEGKALTPESAWERGWEIIAYMKSCFIDPHDQRRLLNEFEACVIEVGDEKDQSVLLGHASFMHPGYNRGGPFVAGLERIQKRIQTRNSAQTTARQQITLT